MKHAEYKSNIRIGTYSMDSAHPMLPTGMQFPGKSWINESLVPRLWGKADLSDTTPPAITGKFVPWDFYAAFSMDWQDQYDFPQYGWQEFQNEYDTFMAVTNYNTHIASNECSFSNDTIITSYQPVATPHFGLTYGTNTRSIYSNIRHPY